MVDDTRYRANINYKMSSLNAQAENAYYPIPSDIGSQTQAIATPLDSGLHVTGTTLGAKKPKRHKKARADESVMGVGDEVLNF